MRRTKLGEIANLCGGRLVAGTAETVVTDVSTDTRSMPQGALFFALVGDRFDAHDFLSSAVANAVACVVSRLPEDIASFPAGLILVDDTLVALQTLAARYRAQLDLKVVCVTGSNGKTSTKDFLSALLGEKFAVNATVGNLNNHIGLPLTMLRTSAEHTCGVWEIGMSNPGEIEPLASLARPDVAVITNIGTAHIEFMKTRDAIAQEKGMLAESVAAEGCVVLNAADDYTPVIAQRANAAVVTAGVGCGDVHAENVEVRGNGSTFDVVTDGASFRVDLPVPGEHMIANATLAAAVGLQLGVAPDAMVTALANVSITRGRLQFRQVNGTSYIDDSYNANPDSMRAALATLKNVDCRGRRIAVLGKMAELGEDSRAIHFELGKEVFARYAVDAVYTVGEEAAEIARGYLEAGGDKAVMCESHADCQQLLCALDGNDLVLVKGSRSAAMENVIPKRDAS